MEDRLPTTHDGHSLALQLSRLVKSFGSQRALDGASLSVAAGECVAIVGESGSGKTTMLRCINRLVDPDSGTVAVNGKPVLNQDATELRRSLDIPVIGAETLPGGVSAVANHLRAGALDMVLCDVYWKGGVTGMLKTASLCESMGVQVASHHGASPVMNFANLHVLAGATSADMIEVLVPEEGYDFALKAYLAPAADGYIEVPDSPGLGVEIDWDYVAAHAV